MCKHFMGAWLTITLAATAWTWLSPVMLHGKSTQDQSPNFWFLQCDSEKVRFLTHDYTDIIDIQPWWRQLFSTTIIIIHHEERKNSGKTAISPDSGKATIGIHVFHEIQRCFFFGFDKGNHPPSRSQISHIQQKTQVFLGLSLSLMMHFFLLSFPSPLTS